MFYIPESLLKIVQQQIKEQQEILDEIIKQQQETQQKDLLELFKKNILEPNIELIEVIKKLTNSIDFFKELKLPENIYNNIQIYKDYYKEINSLIPSTYLKYDKDEKQTFIKSHNFKKLNVPIENSKDIISINNMVDNISPEECSDFINYISCYPMLAYKHRAGKKIYEFLKSQKEKNIINKIIYRVRMPSGNKTIPYTQNEMFEPAYKMPKQNRFSNIGINALYLSEKLEVAKEETDVKKEDRCTWIKLKIKSDLKILDVSDKNIPLFAHCHKMQESRQQMLNVEYLIPNFISDCSRNIGFDGIVYKSIHDESCKNYVLFNVGKRDFEILELKNENYNL